MAQQIPEVRMESLLDFSLRFIPQYRWINNLERTAMIGFRVIMIKGMEVIRNAFPALRE